MCLILLAWRAHPRYPLVVAANRDELHARPTAPLAPWDDAPGVVAGRDLEAGGTWLGLERRGRFAALTNHRDPRCAVPHAPSRGALVTDFLTGPAPAGEHIQRVFEGASRYNGFNLVLADARSAWWCSNRGGVPAPIPDGVHGISNGLLDEPWPKVVSGRDGLATALAAALANGAEPDREALLALLADRSVPADTELPDTGVGLARERALGPRFILDGSYGTRSSTVLTVDVAGRAWIVERTFDVTGATVGERSHEMAFDAS